MEECRVVGRSPELEMTPKSNGKTARVWAGSWRGDTEDGSSFFLYFFNRSRRMLMPMAAGSGSVEISRRDIEALEIPTRVLRQGKRRSREILASLIIRVIKWCF